MLVMRPGQRLYIPGAQVITPLVTSAASGALLTSLISFWELGEASGTRNDSHGTNHLTSNNSVGQATGIVGNAASFTRTSSMSLSIADNASLSTEDIDFTYCAWVYLLSKPGLMSILSKDGATRGTVLSFVTSSDRFVYATPGIHADLRADSFGSPSLSTWYFVVIWHDATANTFNIQINNGAVDSVSDPDAAADNTNAFAIGAQAGTNYWNGRIDQVGFWKRTLTSGERTWLYNSGGGRSYAEIASY
jgi:Concanavalin A-like lectin/glucanases superfamily